MHSKSGKSKVNEAVDFANPYQVEVQMVILEVGDSPCRVEWLNHIQFNQYVDAGHENEGQTTLGAP
jgi:hypothetical protein